jgi:urease accessory protein
MRAAARVVAVAGPDGGTRLTVLRGEPPLLLRRTGPARVYLVGGAAGPARVYLVGGAAGPARVYLVGGAAGPLGGDELHLDIEVGPGASLCLRTVAASIALPNRTGDGSRMEIRATVATGGRLSWLPEPLIAARGCRHHTTSTVELATGAGLVWRDELVCGRHGEPSGDARVGTAVLLDGRPLHQHELAVGPSAPGWSGAAVLGGAGAVGSVLLVDPAWTATGPPAPAVLGESAALMPLAGPAALALATGPDLRAVREHLPDALLDGLGAVVPAPGRVPAL